MEFIDKNGAIKMRFIPLLMILPAIGGLSYGAGLTVGPAFGLLFLCFLCFVNLIGLAMHHDKIQSLQEENARLRDAVLAVSVDQS